METKYKTSQEEFWSGEFGDQYIGRNMSGQLLAGNIHFFSNILKGAEPVKSIH